MSSLSFYHKISHITLSVTQDEKYAGISFEFLAPRQDRDAWVEISDIELTKE